MIYRQICRFTILAVCLIPGYVIHAKSQLAYFYPTSTKIIKIERTLRNDPAASSFSAVGFAKFKDFHSMIKSGRVDYAIMPAPYHQHYPGFKRRLQFTRKGQSSFKYSLVTLEEAFKKTGSSNAVIGIIDELGRRKSRSFAKQLLPSFKFKRVTTVAKFSDLYPLLALGNAGFALFRPDHYEEIKKNIPIKKAWLVATNIESGIISGISAL